MKTELVEKAPFNVVETIVRIAKHLENSKMERKVVDEIILPNGILADYLGTTKEQAILFSIIFALQVKMFNVNVRDIITFLGVSYIDSINYKNDLDRLLELGLIETEEEQSRISKRLQFERSGFTIASEISDQIYANQSIQIKDQQPLDIYGFFKSVSELIQKRKYDTIKTYELFSMIEELENKNGHLSPVTLIKTKLELEDRTLLYEMMNDHITFGAPFTAMELTMSDIYENPREKRIRICQLIEKTNPMISLEYIDLVSGRMANDFNLVLTNRTIEFFLQEDASLFLSTKKAKSIILNEKITSKSLFYDPDLSKEIDFLTESLKNEKFIEIQNRMTAVWVHKGIAAIFYGAPGTGKTESVYQIAKQTGRDIFKVDISGLKSMWFGESEKLIKKVFLDYEKACKQCKIMPILLFNEADAILGKRQENNQSNVGATENAIVNILLEEIERFDGIMIATTNLQGNLDAAFERRFLFKVRFDSPSTDIKAKIWQSKLTDIDPFFAMQLAKDFSFSGGEIDNIVRKATMQEVLTGVHPDSSEIYQFCSSEKFNSSVNKRYKVGYI